MTTTPPAGTTQVYRLYIDAPQQQVWEAITDPAIVEKFFFGAQVEATYEVGGSLRSWAPDRSAQWGDNTILEYDPPKRLAHTWRSLYDETMAAEPESRVTWELEEVADGCTQLTLVHDRLEGSPVTAASVTGWAYILSNLKTVVETGHSLPALPG